MMLLFALVPWFLLAAAEPAVTEQYQIIFLRPDPARKPLSKEDSERIQTAHMANIHALADRGILVAAGPFDDKPHTISGVFFFKIASTEKALREAAKDPTVTEHRNTVEALDWSGPKGLGEEYKRLHKENPQTPEEMGVHPFYLLKRTAEWKAGTTAGKEHAAYVGQLRTKGKLAALGPVSGSESVVEVLIFDRIPDEEASALVAADPAVKSGLLQVEAHRWWSSAHVLPRP
jgi:uncharacterized protein YciI